MPVCVVCVCVCVCVRVRVRVCVRVRVRVRVRVHIHSCSLSAAFTVSFQAWDIYVSLANCTVLLSITKTNLQIYPNGPPFVSAVDG